MNRREFVTFLGGAAAWPLVARGQQTAVPVVAFGTGGTPEGAPHNAAAFRTGLGEHGFVDGRNVAIEETERLPAVIADLVRRRVAAIATPRYSPAALAAKGATATIPIVFG
jgi:putative tryptophan/tyrosine transport system substrate-binding protein